MLDRLHWWGLLLGVAAVALSSGSPCDGSVPGNLDCLGARVNNSWLAQLSPDPEQHVFAPNKEAREVMSGHFVHVKPTPLPDPYLVSYSKDAASMLGLSQEECETGRFARLFSGAADELDGFNASWATPYALSIYGSEQVPNGAGPNGYGYGDGRAISLAEVVVDGGGRWELQLKGSGTTPFCRGSDGRAVLRSSVREFLVSEAMHHLGVPTTRALSLVASASERVQRIWYSKTEEEGPQDQADARDDTDSGRNTKHGGDVYQLESVAMTTRVAPSFLRVGHFELFGRRARRGEPLGLQQLEQLARHALFREYPNHAKPELPLQDQILGMLSEAADRFAKLAAEWVRVGYVQSNFNADNCLVSGLTLDYGPFGFVEEYSPAWGMWIHAGDHFSFMNQPRAAGQNFRMLAESLLPLMDQVGKAAVQRIVDGYTALAGEALDSMWARKLGLLGFGPEARSLVSGLERLLQRHGTDYTIFWRQLSEVPLLVRRDVPTVDGVVGARESLEEVGASSDGRSCWREVVIDEAMPLTALEPAFYKPPPAAVSEAWVTWVRQWLALASCQGRTQEEVAAGMKAANPRYVPRESMLVEAYTSAQRGDHSPLHALQALFRRPYDEQPMFGERYYRRRADGEEKQGGVGFMS